MTPLPVPSLPIPCHGGRSVVNTAHRTQRAGAFRRRSEARRDDR